MTNRKITDLYNVEFTPFDNYGVVVPGMSWHKISYNKENGGNGTYLLKMEPNTKSLPHVHTGFEEFLPRSCHISCNTCVQKRSDLNA